MSYVNFIGSALHKISSAGFRPDLSQLHPTIFLYILYMLQSIHLHGPARDGWWCSRLASGTDGVQSPTGTLFPLQCPDHCPKCNGTSARPGGIQRFTTDFEGVHIGEILGFYNSGPPQNSNSCRPDLPGFTFELQPATGWVYCRPDYSAWSACYWISDWTKTTCYVQDWVQPWSCLAVSQFPLWICTWKRSFRTPLRGVHVTWVHQLCFPGSGLNSTLQRWLA